MVGAIGVGAVAWLALAFVRARHDRLGLGAALGREASAFSPLYVRPAITLLALVSLGLRPLFPYAFTLPVALTQDLGIAQDLLALAWFIAARFPAPRLPAPRPAAVFFMTFVAYALVTPEWARRWEGHPGNEPKYLRQAVAIGHEMSLDAEGVSATMEELTPMPAGAALTRAAATVFAETSRMANAALQGPSAVGASAIRATKITRQTIRGKEGGVYYVLAPGPSLLLAPTLRIDRAINRARGTPGRLAVSVLAWNALGAALVTALFLLLKDATGTSGLAAALAAGFAFTPPFLFYFFQFYPEMVGALILALAFRSLAFRTSWTVWAALALGLELLALPWLHQKFLPVWGVLTLTALGVFVRRRVARGAFVALLLPQVAGAFLTALYNFAITGSARPDALFLAWGPAGVTTARLGQGLLGLLLDARYGIVPYAPIYLLAAAGLVFAIRERSPLLVALPAAAIYYATVAAADNWAGAVCNLGRYFMPVAPLAVAFVGLALRRAASRRGARRARARARCVDRRLRGGPLARPSRCERQRRAPGPECLCRWPPLPARPLHPSLEPGSPRASRAGAGVGGGRGVARRVRPPVGAGPGRGVARPRERGPRRLRARRSSPPGAMAERAHRAGLSRAESRSTPRARPSSPDQCGSPTTPSWRRRATWSFWYALPSHDPRSRSSWAEPAPSRWRAARRCMPDPPEPWSKYRSSRSPCCGTAAVVPRASRVAG